MTRVAFLVDGFNLYHSLIRASADLGGVGTRWLDLHSLCRTFLYQIGGGAELTRLIYFSALAEHVEEVKPGAVARHRTYIAALASRGVQVELGTFKRKWRTCPACGTRTLFHEEKETDVAIAVRLLELLGNDRCDVGAIVSADSDLAPALREVGRSFPDKPVYCCFPYARGTTELRTLAKACFRIRKERYAAHQLPDPVVLADGTRLAKPESW
jgi:uncharacterized LabA/DUF88 family protein